MRALICVLLLSLPVVSNAAVSIEGSAVKPLSIDVTGKARFSQLVDLLQYQDPQLKSYELGIALLRPTLQASQQQQRELLLAQLAQLKLSAELRNELAAQLKQLPITGRVPAVLNTIRARHLGADNLVLIDGDKVVFPKRPTHITVLGATKQAGQYAFVANRSVASWAKELASSEADPSYAYVIQPDGVVQHVAIAYWNKREDSYLAPGAILWLPLGEQT